MDLANYSPETAVEEWLLDRARGNLLLKHAVSDKGIDWVISYAVSLGCSRGIITRTLRDYGLMPKAETRPQIEDPFGDKVRKLWKRDAARLMLEVEKLYAQSQSA